MISKVNKITIYEMLSILVRTLMFLFEFLYFTNLIIEVDSFTF